MRIEVTRIIEAHGEALPCCRTLTIMIYQMVLII